MITVSEQLKKESHNNRRYYVTANVTLADGTKLSLEKKDFYLSGNSIVDSADSGDFPIGIAIEKTASLCLVNDDNRFSDYQFNRAEFTIYINLQLSDRLETIKRGTYIVSKKPTTGAKINLTLLDFMSKSDKTYKSNLSFPCSAGELLRDACQQSGIALGDADFENSDYQIQNAPENTTFRAVIGMVAALAGGNARIDEDDLLRIVTFRKISTTSTPDHELVAVKNVSFDLDTITVSGVKFEDTVYGDEGYVLDLKNNQLVASNKKDAVARIGKILTGFTILPFSLSSIAIAYATFGDIVKFEDTRGTEHVSIATDIEFTFGGNTEFSCKARSVEEQEQNYPDGVQIKVDQSLTETKKELSAYDTKLKQMNELAANSLGFYTSEELREDGSIIVYRHNKPQMSESTVIYKTAADGFFLSTDGGKSWKAGFDSNGDAVLNILSVIGINADWINVGTLLGKFINAKGMKVTDKDNRTTFYVDEDGKVIILPEAFLLADKSIDQTIIEKAQEEAKKQTALNVILSNEYQGIPTDANGNYTTLPECNTIIQVLFGAADVTNDATYTVTEQDISGTWDVDKHTYTVTGISADTGYVDFLIKYQELSVEKRFTVVKQKQGTSGADAVMYYTEANATVVMRSTDGTYVPETILFKNYKKTGTNAASYSSYIRVQTSVDGSTFTDIKSALLLSGQYTLTLSSISSDVTAIRYILEDTSLPRKTLAVLTIPVINDAELTEQQIFNLLTESGTRDLLTYVDGKLFLNGTYIKGKTVAADKLNVEDLRSVAAAIAEWLIKTNYIQSKNGNIVLYSDGRLKIGSSIFQKNSGDEACVVKYGLHIYCKDNSTEDFSDGSGMLFISGLTSSTSGTTLVLKDRYVYKLSSSSRRYKDHVRNMDLAEAEKLLNVPVVWFRYKDGYLHHGDRNEGKPIPGFYAEDVFEQFPEGVVLNDDQIEDWNYRTMIPAMLKIIQGQQERISKLEQLMEGKNE